MCTENMKGDFENKILRIPGTRILPAGDACAADRCFLLANCCSWQEAKRTGNASDLPKREIEKRRKGKNNLQFTAYPS